MIICGNALELVGVRQKIIYSDLAHVVHESGSITNNRASHTNPISSLYAVSPAINLMLPCHTMF